MDFPSVVPARPVISTVNEWSAIGFLQRVAQASAAWASANRAVYMPFTLSTSYLVQRLWWANGSAVAGNVDCGIYTSDGVRLVSTGSTAQAGTSVVQSVSITPLLLTPGRYYMGLAASSTSATFLSDTVFLVPGLVGLAQEASALPLPAQATFAATTGRLYVCGITSRTVI